MKLDAKWIWKKQRDYNTYNQTVVAKRRFRLSKIKQAVIAITADSYYRLYINDVWVNDGPCRSWPEHYQYDEIDVTTYLRQGINEIKVVAKYFGVGTMHQVPKQAGLLVQLDVTPAKGRKVSIISDGTWEFAEAKAWVRNTPKMWCQQEPCEYYDARFESPMTFSKAAVLYDARGGPWRDLHPRDCALLTRQAFDLRNFVEANTVASEWTSFTFGVAQLLHPGLIECNRFVSTASAVTTIIVAKNTGKIRIESDEYAITVNGKKGKNGVYQVRPGGNFLFAVVRNYFGHGNKETTIRFVENGNIKFRNPLKATYENPWCFVPLEEGSYVSDDIVFPWFTTPEREAFKKRVEAKLAMLLRRVVDLQSFKSLVGKQAKCVPSRKMLFKDPYKQFRARKVIDDAHDLVENPLALMHDNGEVTVVHPSKLGDVELVYDLGEQNCGYYRIELVADAGVRVDIFGIEYINKAGEMQHTHGYRNGMRYICKDGVNSFISLKRRSGRYLYITLRNQKRPVKIRLIQLIESTYPVAYKGNFSCSDPMLDRIWEISARTVKLCMEDTFVDCPLYEQTLWVGDARNEAAFAYTVFGETDLAKRCLTLAGQSLERFPIVGCQVPSAWESILPAWSFLWGIAVWDYYYYTGDIQFLKKVWKWVKENLRGSARFIDDRGLFSAPFWNMFDWTGIDDQHRTVLHNSMFIVGAIDAATECADAVRDNKTKLWLREYRRVLVKSINRLWDDKRKAYPDSVHEDGSVSTTVSQHTSFLAILYDIIREPNKEGALKNILAPPKNMIRVGSPFAIMYLYEALEKARREDHIVRSIYENYVPMVNDGATTVWESFSRGSLRFDGFPTRSHCHAWSAAPIHFLNRIVLGIKQTSVGGASFDISPRLNKLTWAKGATATVHGPVKVEWRKVGRKLHVTASAPSNVKLRFVKNDTHKGLDIIYNRRNA